jgi:glycosyltransferase involved in cell wall biosynthesis
MRVAIVAPPFYEIPPQGYGGTELVCYLLAEELKDRGHDVTVIGAGPRRTRAGFIATFARNPPEGGQSGLRSEAAHAVRAAEAIDTLKPDIVHVHTTMLPTLARPIPMVVTVHGATSGPDATTADLPAIARQAALVAISHAQAAAAAGVDWAAVIHNGIDLRRYPDGGQRGESVLYLGRISAHKGTHLAIDAAMAAGREIVIAGGPTIPEEHAYFDARIRPRLGPRLAGPKGPGVRWEGEVGFERKVELLREAACLLFPACWQEPFGLVLAEAMACGTPVVALAAGAVPELVASGRTGILCQSPGELSGAIERARGIDPDICRARASKFFSAARMASEYERLYRRLVAG